MGPGWMDRQKIREIEKQRNREYGNTEIEKVQITTSIIVEGKCGVRTVSCC